MKPILPQTGYCADSFCLDAAQLMDLRFAVHHNVVGELLATIEQVEDMDDNEGVEGDECMAHEGSPGHLMCKKKKSANATPYHLPSHVATRLQPT